jgi:hypothetical protein
MKVFMVIASIIFLGIGAVLIWSGYEVYKSPYNDITPYTYAADIIIACGAIILLMSFLGCLGAWKRNKLALAVFIIFVLIVAVLCIAFGAVALYARKKSSDYFGDQASCIQQFGDADQAANLAASALCLLYCPCLDDSAYVANYTAGNSSYFTSTTVGATNIMTCNPCMEINNTNPVVQQNLTQWIQDNLHQTVNNSNCSISQSTFEKEYFTTKMRDYMPVLTWIENTFDCSGLCTPQELYLFSDINNGKPKNSCLTEVNDWAQKYFLVAGVIAIIFGIFMVRKT